MLQLLVQIRLFYHTQVGHKIVCNLKNELEMIETVKEMVEILSCVQMVKLEELRNIRSLVQLV